MKRLVAIILALAILCNSAAAATFRVFIEPGTKTQGWSKQQTSDQIKAGLRNHYGAVANIKFKFVDDPALADVRVLAEPLTEKSEYRGDGVLRLNRNPVFTAQLDIQRHVAHVFGHYLGYPDEADPNCIMHELPGPWFCEDQLKSLELRFGPSKQHDEP